jgi:predicted RNA-binding Zn-ribbon protein involved in translation (DUF1610 family)
MNNELLYLNGLPFHAAGTRVFEEAEGTVIFECPQCGCRPVLRCWVEGLRGYARKRG